MPARSGVHVVVQAAEPRFVHSLHRPEDLRNPFSQIRDSPQPDAQSASRAAVLQPPRVDPLEEAGLDLLRRHAGQLAQLAGVADHALPRPQPGSGNEPRKQRISLTHDLKRADARQVELSAQRPDPLQDA